MTGREAGTVILAALPAVVALAALALAGPLSAATAVVVAVVVVAGIAIALRLAGVLGAEAEGGEGPVADVERRRGAALAATVSAFPDPVLVLDGNRRIIVANGEALRLFGHDPTGRDLAVALRDPAVLKATDEILAAAPGAGREVGFRTVGAAPRVMVARLAALAPAAAGGAAAVLALSDATQAARVEAMRADFVANVSHELRTPLSTLIGFIETLQGPARDDAKARDEFLGVMQEQAARMARLIDDLLSLSRIEVDEHTLPTGRVAIAPLLGSVVRLLAHRAHGKGMRIVVEVADGCPDAVGDSDQLTQVFQNLVQNAIKYGREGTEVRITAAGGGDNRVAIAVADHGIGIPRQHIPRLTERFYRVDKARSRAAGGTGLGLAIVKHIVNRHRGRLEIESEEGVGSIFTVRLPAAPTTGDDTKR